MFDAAAAIQQAELTQKLLGQRTRQRWMPHELSYLESSLGKRQPKAMAAHLNRPLNQVLQRIRQMGYLIAHDVRQPLGITATALARRLSMGVERVCKDIEQGVLQAHREGKKDFCIAWPDVQKYEQRIQQLQRRRVRALAQPKEPTLSKQVAMQRLGLSETHITRYLRGGVLKAWKVPCKWTTVERHRWEWRISMASVEKVKAARENGHLRLRKKAYRRIADADNAKVTQMRRAGRLGQRDDLHQPRSALRSGHYTVSQVASHVGISAQQVYEHIRLGRMQGQRTKVGTRNFWSIAPDALPAYLEWCQREVKATGPMQAWGGVMSKIHALGLMTLSEAAAACGTTHSRLAGAVTNGRLQAEKVGRMRAVREVDVHAYLESR